MRPRLVVLRVHISRRVEDKIWREHHVTREEVEQVLLDDEAMEIFPGQKGKASHVAVGRTYGNRILYIPFYYRKGVADVATALD